MIPDTFPNHDQKYLKKKREAKKTVSKRKNRKPKRTRINKNKNKTQLKKTKTKNKNQKKNYLTPKLLIFFPKKKYLLKMLSAIEYNFAHEHSIIIKKNSFTQ